MGNIRNKIIAVFLSAVAALIVINIPNVRSDAREKLDLLIDRHWEPTENECSIQAYKKYIQKRVAITNPDAILNIKWVLAIRRLEEDFCLEYAHCNRPDMNNWTMTSVSEDARLDRCLNILSLEKYGAWPPAVNSAHACNETCRAIFTNPLTRETTEGIDEACVMRQEPFCH
jgi:hypothetical protein